ncbi:MAG TPA: DUF3450 family protein [Pseudohongiella sp.]|nr:DUF3450 family protein [Pseudohongiella sp.]
MKSLQYISRSVVRRPMAAAAVVLAALSSVSVPASAQSLQEQFNEANATLEAMIVANQQLRTRIERQEQLILDMAAAIEHAALLADEENSPLNSLIERMMSSIEQIVANDLPFEVEARREQVQRIRNLVNNPQAPIAQKLSMLIGLYQAEAAYGRSLATYEDTLEVNGVEQEVTMTRIGRIMLAYQTADRQITAVWDNEARQWVELSPGEFRAAMTRAYQVADGSLAPEMIHIPIQHPVAAQ